MKKLFAMLLVAVMALSLFVACGETEKPNTDTGTLVPTPSTSTPSTSTDSDTGSAVVPSTNTDAEKEEGLTTASIVGDWVFEMALEDFSEAFKNAGFSGSLSGHFVFKADGTASMFFNKEEVAAAMRKMVKELLTLEYIAAQSNVTVEQLEAALAQQGTTFEAYRDSVMDPMLDNLMAQPPFSNTDAEGNIILGKGNYKVENGKIYISSGSTFAESDGQPYTYVDGKITIKMNESMNLVMTRK